MPGQYLHPSNTAYKDRHPDADCLEISLSFRTTTFVVSSHLQLADDTPTSLKAGQMIQLCHKV